MALMKKIRNAKNKKSSQIAFIIILALIVVGLVISFAFMGTSNIKTNVSSNDISSQIKTYESAISQSRSDLAKNPGNYSTVKGLADLLYNVGNLYGQNSQNTKMTAAFIEAGDLYLEALKYAPTELNDAGKASLYYQAGMSYWFGSEDDLSTENFEKAIALAPASYEINATYATVLFYSGKTEVAVKVVDNCLAAMGEDGEYYSEMLSFKENLAKSIEELSKAAENESTTENSGETTK